MLEIVGYMAKNISFFIAKTFFNLRNSICS